MGKYEITPLNLDEFELKYYKTVNTDNNEKNGIKEEKTIKFKRTVELARKLQSIEANARFEMYDYLTKHGKSKNDLIIERKDENGKIIVDETNYREFEANFLMNAQYKATEEMFKELFNMSLIEIITELELDSNEAKIFGSKISGILLNGIEQDKIPS